MLFPGVEILYEMYDPRLIKVEVLRLEKRLDSHLLYLRDAEPHFSTFPFDMEAEFHADGAPVPVNPIKVCTNFAFLNAQIFPNFLHLDPKLEYIVLAP
jgi:hypothetical protein